MKIPFRKAKPIKNPIDYFLWLDTWMDQLRFMTGNRNNYFLCLDLSCSIAKVCTVIVEKNYHTLLKKELSENENLVACMQIVEAIDLHAINYTKVLDDAYDLITEINSLPEDTPNRAQRKKELIKKVRENVELQEFLNEIKTLACSKKISLHELKIQLEYETRSPLYLKLLQSF
jgi:hypothetical protein